MASRAGEGCATVCPEGASPKGGGSSTELTVGLCLTTRVEASRITT